MVSLESGAAYLSSGEAMAIANAIAVKGWTEVPSAVAQRGAARRGARSPSCCTHSSCDSAHPFRQSFSSRSVRVLSASVRYQYHSANAQRARWLYLLLRVSFIARALWNSVLEILYFLRCCAHSTREAVILARNFSDRSSAAIKCSFHI